MIFETENPFLIFSSGFDFPFFQNFGPSGGKAGALVSTWSVRPFFFLLSLLVFFFQFPIFCQFWASPASVVQWILRLRINFQLFSFVF